MINKRQFWGFKYFSILGFYWVRKFDKYLFWEWLDLSREFLSKAHIENNLKTCVSARPGSSAREVQPNFF